MAVTIQYGSDLSGIVTARSSGARSPISPGNHRGVVRHTSAIATLTADLDYVSGTVGTTGGDYDILGLMEFVPDIRIIGVRLKTSNGVGDVDLIAYDPDDPLETSKHVSIIEGLKDLDSTNDGGSAFADTSAGVQSMLEAAYPFTTDNYSTKLVQGSAGTDEIDISAACPIPDGVSGVNHGTFGLALAAGTSTAQLSSGETVQINLLYVHE